MQRTCSLPLSLLKRHLRPSGRRIRLWLRCCAPLLIRNITTSVWQMRILRLHSRCFPRFLKQRIESAMLTSCVFLNDRLACDGDGNQRFGPFLPGARAALPREKFYCVEWQMREAHLPLHTIKVEQALPRMFYTT